MRKLVIPAVVVVAALALVLHFVRSKGPSKAVTGAPVKFSYQDRVADAVSIVAIRKVLFREEGLNVEPLRFSSGPACSETLYTGSADVATMGDATAIIAASRSAPARIIASHGGGEHRHRIVTRADSAIGTPGDLAGKRVAVKKGTSTYGGFLAFLAANDIDPARIHIIDMRPADMPDALVSASVDAIVASEPTPSLAESRGARELATLGGLGNTYPILLMARDEFLKSRPQDTVRFLRAMARAASFIRLHPEEAASIVSEATGLAPSVAVKAMARHSYEVGLDAVTIASLRKTAGFLGEHGTIRTLPDLTVAVEPRHLELAVRELGQTSPAPRPRQ